MFELHCMDDETWRQCVGRVARQHGMEQECLELYDRYVAHGDSEPEAALNALYEWDCLPYVEPPYGNA